MGAVAAGVKNKNTWGVAQTTEKNLLISVSRHREARFTSAQLSLKTNMIFRQILN